MVVRVSGQNFELPGFGATSNFLCKKILFLAIFTHFLCAEFYKSLTVIKKWQYLPLLEILLPKLKKNKPKKAFFGQKQGVVDIEISE